MNCLECQELLQRRLDGAAVSDRAALERHLASCPECRERHAAAGLLLDGLRGLSRPEPPAGLAERTAALVLQDRARRLRRRLWAGAALAASLLLAAAGYLWLVPPRGEPPPAAKAPAPKVKDATPPVKAGPSLRQSVDEASEALEALANRFAAQTQVLQKSTASLEFVSLDAVPRVSVLSQPLDSTAEGLRQGGRSASAGIKTVSGSARRALNYFFRKMPPLHSAEKRVDPPS